MQETKSKNLVVHSYWILISYNMFEFIGQIIGKTFNSLYLYYYETKILLAGGFILAAQIIFSIWNAINDPIAGYLCNRQTRWTKKWGKYFPWVVIAGVPMFVFFFLIFAPPESLGGWGLFFWMLLTLCMADTFSSVYSINIGGMYPEKFRSEADRRRSGQVNTIVGSIGMVVASVVPPLLYSFDDPRSFTTMAAVMAAVGFLLVLLNIPGAKADPEMLEAHQIVEPQPPFFSLLKQALKNRIYLIYISVIFLYNLFMSFALSSLPYFVDYVMGIGASSQTLIWGGMIIGIFISLPLWNSFYKKHDVANTLLAGFLIMGVSIIPLVFFENLYIVIGVFFLVGIGLGGFWVAYLPFFGDVMDHMYLSTGKRNTGVYMGIRTFFLRFTIIVQTGIFLLIHNLTGFAPAIEDAEGNLIPQPQSPEALFGIRIHAVIIPIVAVLLGCWILWRLYDIKGDKKREMVKQLAKQAESHEKETQ